MLAEPLLAQTTDPRDQGGSLADEDAELIEVLRPEFLDDTLLVRTVRVDLVEKVDMIPLVDLRPAWVVVKPTLGAPEPQVEGVAASNEEASATTTKTEGFVTLGAGGGLLVAGVIVLLTAPSRTAQHASSFRFLPTIAKTGAGAAFSMDW